MMSAGSRERTIVELLRLLADGLSDVREGVAGDDGAVPLRTHANDCKLRQAGLKCSCWLRSIDELQRCLRLMRNGGRSSSHAEWTQDAKLVRRRWAAVHGRYVVAERRPMVVKVVKGVPQPSGNVEVVGLVNALDLDKRGNGFSRLLCETWKPTVDVAEAERGVGWLSASFAGTPNLPAALLRIAA